jgi:hypothetical protein
VKAVYRPGCLAVVITTARHASESTLAVAPKPQIIELASLNQRIRTTLPMAMAMDDRKYARRRCP